MRVLFALYAEKTHLQPMVPLAWALRLAGHDVRVATQPALVPAVTQSGLTAVEVGRDHNLWRTARRFLTPRVAQADPALYDRVRGVAQAPFDIADDPPESISWEHLRQGYERTVPAWYRMVNEPMVDDLVAYARTWRPDLVLWESATYAGPVAARAVGAAHGRMLCNLDMFGVARGHFLRLAAEQPGQRAADPLAEWLTALGSRYGVDFQEELTTGQFTVDQHPAAIRMEAALRYVPMRYVPYNGAAVVPRWLWQQPDRPRVCLTLGSTSTEGFDGYAVDVADIVRALADLPIELVATLSAQSRERLGALPANVRVVPFVALHALAPTCAVVIHHGAFGTASTAAFAGVPQLSLYERHDAPYQAARLTRYGAGLSIHYREATAETVRAAVGRLLTEPSFAARAADLRAELLAMPSPAEVVPALVELTGAGRDRGSGPR